MSPSRRDVLATAGAAVAALSGCTDDSPGTPSDERPPDDSPVDSPGGGRPTATARDPVPLDVSGTWPQRGSGPDNDGVTDAAGVPGNARVRWQLRRIRSGPVALADGTLFHYGDLGEDTSGRPTLTPTADPDDGPAHIVSGVPHLVARDASGGHIQWAVELPGSSGGLPAVAGGRVVATARGRVSARDAGDGTEQWSVALGEHPVGSPAVAGDVVVVPLPGVVDGRSGEYVHEPEVRAFSLDDGQSRWTVDAPARGVDVGVGGGVVAVVAHDYDGSGTVQVRSLADGAERWRTDLSGQFAFEGPVLSEGRVYVAASEGTLRALALSDGAERWSVRKAGDGLAATAETVYVAHQRQLYARDAADGSVRWSVGTDGESGAYYVTPAVGEQAVYAGTYGVDAHVQAFDRTDGTERWSSPLPNTVVEGDMVVSGLEAQPTVAEGAVYAYAADGLYAFGPADGS